MHLRGEAVFPAIAQTSRYAVAALNTLLPTPLVSHPRDPDAFILTSRWFGERTAELGAWAGKIGSHDAHHRFGALGRLPHVQVNVWRVGVKGSGISYRVPLVNPMRALVAVSQLLV